MKTVCESIRSLCHIEQNNLPRALKGNFILLFAEREESRWQEEHKISFLVCWCVCVCVCVNRIERILYTIQKKKGNNFIRFYSFSTIVASVAPVKRYLVHRNLLPPATTPG